MKSLASGLCSSRVMGPALLALTLLALLAAGPAAAQHDATGDLASTKVEARRVLAELNEIERERHEASGEVEELQEKIEALEGERAAHEGALSEARGVVQERARGLRARIRLLYRLNRTGFLRILFSSEDPADLRKRTKYLVALLRETRGQVQDFMREVRSKEEALENLEDSRASLLALQVKAEDRRRHLTEEEGRQKRLLEEINSKKDLALQVLRERATTGGFMDEDFGGAITLSPGQDPAPSGAITLSQPRQSSFRDLQGQLSWPVRGRLMRAYGAYTDPNTGGAASNLGIDIRADNFAPIRCVAGGVIQYAGFIEGYGMTVVVDHDAEYATVYAHASKLSVDVGQLVRKDEVLGTVGETGVTDGQGPRLHFEVRYRKTPQNPLDWLGTK